MFRKALNIAANNPDGIDKNLLAPNITSNNNVNISLGIKRIKKIKSSVMICEDGTEAPLFSPMPGLYWKCIARCDDNGVATLAKKVEGLILSLDGNSYCLGISGATDEFEVRMQVGQNEVRLNDDFLNLAAQHVVINGLEYEE